MLQIPKDPFQNILGYIPAKTLVISQSVSKRWKEKVNSRSICEAHYRDALELIDSTEDFLKDVLSGPATRPRIEDFEFVLRVVRGDELLEKMTWTGCEWGPALENFDWINAKKEDLKNIEAFVFVKYNDSELARAKYGEFKYVFDSKHHWKSDGYVEEHLYFADVGQSDRGIDTLDLLFVREFFLCDIEDDDTPLYQVRMSCGMGHDFHDPRMAYSLKKILLGFKYDTIAY